MKNILISLFLFASLNVGSQTIVQSRGNGSGSGGSVSVATKTFAGSIAFDNIITNYGTVNVTSDNTITVNAAGAIVGFGATISLVGDGVHQVSFNGFVNENPSITFDNTSQMDNVVVLSCAISKNGKYYTYNIIRQTYTNTTPIATVSALGSPDTLTSTKHYIHGHYAYSDADGDLEGASKYSWWRSSTSGGAYNQIGNKTTQTYFASDTDNLQYLKFGVIPYALTGLSPGSLTLSTAAGIGSLDANATTYLDTLGIPNDGTIFFNATGYQITGQQLRTAVQLFVSGLRADTLYSNCIAMWPYIGGDSIKHKVNLITPNRYQNASFRAQWRGTLTHDGSGVLPNGTNGYARTTLTPSTYPLNVNSNTLVTYTASSTANTNRDMGCSGGGAGHEMYMVTGLNTYYENNFGGSYSVASGGSLGLWVDSRYGASLQTIYKNGALLEDNNVATGTLPTSPLFLFVENVSGTPTYFSDRKSMFMGIWSGLAKYQIVKLSARINALETALHRNTY